MPVIERDRRRWLVRDALLGPCELCGAGPKRRRMSLDERDATRTSFDVTREWRLHNPQEIVAELRKFDRVCGDCRRRRQRARTRVLGRP